MILGNVRASLTRDDAQLALHLLAQGSRAELERGEARLRDEGIDALLDDPRLVAAVMHAGLGAQTSLPLFCYAVTRKALRSVGADDRALADYVAAIVLHFGLGGRATRISEHDDEQYDSLAALLDDVDGPDAQRTFLVRQHLGNYALWLSGMFPDWIQHRRWRRGGPDLDYYEDLGRRGFALAADHRLARQHGLAPVFLEAARCFPELRAALNACSDALLFPGHPSPERLMRQVRSEFALSDAGPRR